MCPALPLLRALGKTYRSGPAAIRPQEEDSDMAPVGSSPGIEHSPVFTYSFPTMLLRHMLGCMAKLGTEAQVPGETTLILPGAQLGRPHTVRTLLQISTDSNCAPEARRAASTLLLPDLRPPPSLSLPQAGKGSHCSSPSGCPEGSHMWKTAGNHTRRPWAACP